MKKTLCLATLVAIIPFCSFGQMIGPSAYMIGDNLEIGINDGGHEGAPFLAGSNNRSDAAIGSPVYFGFVANPQLDGWVDYDGDFFTPGSPENGFGLEIEGINYSNNASGELEEIEGSITGYETDGDCISVFWDGSVGDIDMNIVYRMVSTELYYTTEITLTNTGATDYTDVYYYRNLDPDNNVTLSFDYTTQNTIVDQPIPGCEKALVSATQTDPWDSYIGLGAIGANFRVSHGGFANRDASDIWDGVGGLEGTVGASVFADQAISMAYKIDDLPAGESERFLFTIVLDEDNIDAAISSLYYFSDEDLGTECSPLVDTAYVCEGGMVELSINGTDVDLFDWTWSPPDGLSTVDGPTTDASPLVTTEYMLVGVPIGGCVDSEIEKSILVEVITPPEIEIIDPGALCAESYDLTTLVVNDLGGIAAEDLEVKFYSVMPDSMDQVAGLWPSDLIYPGETTFVLLGTVGGGCFVVDTFSPDFGGVANAGPDNTEDVCNTPGTTVDLNFLLTGATEDGIWTNLSGVAGFDPVTAMLDASGLPIGDYIFRYTVGGGACPADEADITITILPNPIIDAGIDQTICAGDITTVNGAGGVSYLWDGGAIDGLPLMPLLTTTYTVVGTDANGCIGTDDMEIVVNPLPIVDAGVDQLICEGETAVLSGVGVDAFVWSDGVVDGVPFTPPVGTNTYELTATDINGCVGMDEVVVAVNALPDVSAADDFTVCAGTAITLSGVGAPILTWDGGVVDDVPFMPTVTTTYTLTGTDAIGCTNSDAITVTVAAVPVPNFSADVTAGCYPLEVTFTNLAPLAGTDCQWIIDGNTISGCDEITYTFNTVGCFNVTLGYVSAGGCYGETTYGDYICVEGYPTAEFYATPDDLTSENPVAEMVNTSVDATSYVWDFGDGSANSVDESPIHNYPQTSGTYEVSLVASNNAGCEDVASATIVVKDEMIFYIPNAFTPDGDDFNETFKPIFTSGLDIYDYHLTIFNRWGEVVFESYNVATGWPGTYGSRGVSEDGVYIWRIEYGDTNSDEKHIKEGHVTVLK